METTEFCIMGEAANLQATGGQPKSFITTSPLRNYIEQGLKMEQPKELIKNMLVEQETTILFGDTGLGKSTLAMQMACEVAEQEKSDGSRRNVLYVNFELSQQQWAKRFPKKTFPDNLFIANVDYTLMRDVTDQSRILDEIQCQAVENNIEVVVIDNLTNLCVNSKDGSEAGNIMLQLLGLRMTHKWTMLILAHVPKRKPSDPLSLNDLAGSKILSNLADNVVGLNKSKEHKDARYIIQLKCRSFGIELDAKNVQELRLVMDEEWLHFEMGEYSEERKLLPCVHDEKAELEQNIVEMLQRPDHPSYREIAELLGTDSSKVYRVAKEHGLGMKKGKK